jgi:hypothetical protein
MIVRKLRNFLVSGNLCNESFIFTTHNKILKGGVFFLTKPSLMYKLAYFLSANLAEVKS